MAATTVPSISGGLPLLGHAADFFRSPVDLLRRGYREHGVSRPGIGLSFIGDGRNAASNPPRGRETMGRRTLLERYGALSNAVDGGKLSTAELPKRHYAVENRPAPQVKVQTSARAHSPPKGS